MSCSEFNNSHITVSSLKAICCLLDEWSSGPHHLSVSSSWCQRGICSPFLVLCIFFCLFLLFISKPVCQKKAAVVSCSVHINRWSSSSFIRLPSWTTKSTIFLFPPSTISRGFLWSSGKGRHVHHYYQNTLFKNCEMYTLAKGVFIFKEIKYIWPYLWLISGHEPTLQSFSSVSSSTLLFQSE